VGIGTLAVARLCEKVLAEPIEKLDVDTLVARWPTWKATKSSIAELFTIDELRDKAIEETRAKYLAGDELRAQLTKLRNVWPELKRRLLEQLVPSNQLATMLRDAGAPSRCEEIGISADRLCKSHRLAMHIRRRFTVLDLADRIGLLDA
jgi:glycerol-1-phosphate dehydrogenase [NAD(P)+]